jgi:hypothetical protein
MVIEKTSMSRIKFEPEAEIDVLTVSNGIVRVELLKPEGREGRGLG